MKPKLQPTQFEAFGTLVNEDDFLEKSNNKKAEAKKAKEKLRQRRHKLHAIIKRFAVINARKRLILLDTGTLSQCATDQLDALIELRDRFKYSLQPSLF